MDLHFVLSAVGENQIIIILDQTYEQVIESLRKSYHNNPRYFLFSIGKESILPGEGTTYKFLIFKGVNKFDESKVPLQANFKEVNGVPTMSVGSVKLNFYIMNSSKLRKPQFILKLIQTQKQVDHQIGQYIINLQNFITNYKEENIKRYQLKTFFSQDYELDFQIYIQKNRALLQKTIRDHQKNEQNDQDKDNKITIIVNNLNKRSSEINQYSLAGDQDRLRPTKDTDQIINVLEVRQVPGEFRPIIQESESPEIDYSPERMTFQKAESIFQSFLNEPIPTSLKNLQKWDKEASVQPSSLQKLPLIQTKFKQLTNSTAVFEIHRRQTSLLGSSSQIQLNSTSESSPDQTNKYIMWLFMFLGTIVLYFAMHPAQRK